MDLNSDAERYKVVKKARVIKSRVELEKVRLSRLKIYNFVHHPIFKKTVINVARGNSPNKQTNATHAT